MNLLRFFRSASPIVLAVMVITMTSAMEVEHSFVMAADGHAKEQGKAQDKRKQADANHGDVKESKAPRLTEEEKESREEKGEKDTPSGEGGAEQSNSGGEKKTASEAQQPLASPTPVATVAISAILVDDPCRVSGTISFSGAYSGWLTLGLTYHVTGGGEFVPTGSTWSHDFGSQDSADFVLSPGLPQDFAAGPRERVNSYRVEVIAASSELSNMTAKSDSFHCEEETVVPSPIPTPPPTLEPPAPATATPIDTPTRTVTSTPTPTIIPTVVPTGTSTPTSTPLPAITPGVTPSATPTSTAVATPSPTPTSTAVATQGGATKIGPDNSASADPGATVVYMHIVQNPGPVSDIKEITAISSQGWTVSLFAADGTTPLMDTNQNGSVDTGLIGAGQSKGIVVKVMVPPGAMRGATDVTTVTAMSAGSPGASNSATAANTTTVNGVITISLSTSTVEFGSVSPSGAMDPGAVNVWSTTDGFGAHYVKDQGLQITVSSNSAWTGTVWAQENVGSASSIRISDGDLQWRLEGDLDWTPLHLSSSTFGEGRSGSSSHWYDYRLRILWEDDPGDFKSAVTYRVTQ
jgi:hypothetical protein